MSLVRRCSSLPALLGGMVLLVAGCQGGGPVAPFDPASTVDAAPAVRPTDTRVSLYEVAVDPATLSWQVTHHPARSAAAQPPQALTYDLDIEQFLNGDSFDVEGLAITADGDFAFTFSHAHPFGAPDLTLAPTGLNRADLGYTGKLLVLANRTSQSFFGGSITLDPDFLLNPDGYANPGDLLFSGGLTNNTFPYMLLVDEAKDNRVGVSNGASPTGNYLDDPAGWQASTIGPAGDGWTGYDYLHGGQRITNQFVIDQDALSAGPASFAVAFVIKYTDPRGTGGRVARLPQATANPQFFAYRLPFAAADVSQVAITSGAVRVDVLPGESDTLSLAVRDWDAGASEAADADLSDETDVTLVPPGTAAAPVVEVDAPFLAANPIPIAATGTGSGLPGDELVFSGPITNELGTAVAGEQLALIRVIDPEDTADDAAGYHFGVDPTTILPDAARALTLRTYLPLPITLVDVASCPFNELLFDFEDQSFALWEPGGLGLPNGDFDGWGGFSFGCDVSAAEGTLPNLAGRYLTTTNDAVGSSSQCGFPEDYGSDAEYNIVSPEILIPELCGNDEVAVTFSGGMWTRTGATFRVYSSIDDGDSWDMAFEQSTTGSSQAFDAQRVVLPAAIGEAPLRIRFEFEDPTNDTYAPAQPYVGLFLDEIGVSVSGFDPPVVPSPDDCAVWTEKFEGDTSGWVEYGLPETDAAIAEGAACGAPGPWGTPAVCPAGSGAVAGMAMTFGADDGFCGSFDADLAHSSDFNIVSPELDWSAVTAAMELRFDEITGSWPGLPTWTTTVYAANDPAPGDPSEANWGVPLIVFEHQGGEVVGSTVLSAALPTALLGQTQVRLRFQVTTEPDLTDYAACPDTPNICECFETVTFSENGFGLDNLRIGDFAACD